MMHPKQPGPRDLDTLMWEYLDGETTPEHLDQLEQLLLESDDARDTFVEASQLHVMLHSHFRDTQAMPAHHDAGTATAQAELPMPRRKRRGRKSNAA
ncbi:MAG: hypothetical protein ACIAXF_17115 [Phycisphaerales bacterium JB063]